MRVIVKILVVLLLCLVAVGFVRQWFVLTSDQEANSNKVQIQLSVDPDKMKHDADSLKQKANELTEQAK